MKDVFILEGARTPFGTFGGALKDVGATALGVTSSKEALKRSGVEPEEVDFSVTGNVIHSEKNASYISRHIALETGIPFSSPSLTVNRLCGSGLQAVISTAQSIKLGEGEVGLACGTENMSQSPYALFDTRFGLGLKSPKTEDMLWATLTDAHCGIGMGITAENLAKKYNITREEQDQFALESQQRASAARNSGIFSEEIVPVEIVNRKGTVTVTDDEHIRENTSFEGLSNLKPAFAKDGSVTSGNASGINDGAASIVVASEYYVSRNNKKTLARIVSWSVAGVDPNIMGIGPVPAMKNVLNQSGLSIEDIDLVEVNEAFAAQYLSVEKELGLDRAKTNVHGGAIALGHPVGASGARILYSLILELRRRKARYGIASLCIGGGQGIAVLVEAL